MTIEEARRVGSLLKTMDDAAEWRMTFQEPVEKERKYVLFENVVCCADIDGGGVREVRQGALRLPRDIAIEAMAWIEKRAKEELARLGCSDV